MTPTPPHIPIYGGGLSDIALRRAARHDGWIGDLISLDQAIERVDKLRALRAEKGLTMDDFTVLTPLTDAFTIPHYERAAAAGIDDILTMPWMFYSGPDARWPTRSTGCAGSARTWHSTTEAASQAPPAPFGSCSTARISPTRWPRSTGWRSGRSLRTR